MNPTLHRRERKIVPRFRRNNDQNNLVDIDDQVAQTLIEKDLQSHFVWTSDTTEQLKSQLDNYQEEHNYQQISITDQSDEHFLYDIDHQNEQLWKTNFGQHDNQSIQWTHHDQEQNSISFSLINTDDKDQQWSLKEQNEKIIQLNLTDQNPQEYKHDLETDDHQEQTFHHGDEFRNKMQFGIHSEGDEELNGIVKDCGDVPLMSLDSSIPSIECVLSLPQAPIILRWLEGISEYTLSLPMEKFSSEYSPLNETKSELDCNDLKSLKWSLDLLKENLLRSYLLSLPNTEHDQFSLPDIYHYRSSLPDEQKKQFYSIIDHFSEQRLSYFSNDFQSQLFSIIDSIKKEHNFGHADQGETSRWSLEDFQVLFQRFSPEELLHCLYSPNDVEEILLERILIESDEVSARALRRYRCKHMSIKTDQTDQLDHQEDFSLQFQGNESIAIGESTVQNDLNEEQTFSDLTSCEILINSVDIQLYDIEMSNCSPRREGPCLYRSDYERQPPKTPSRFRREIGYISYDASFEHPIYRLDKSFKRFVHVPTKRDHCSYNVFQGYEQFQDKLSSNPHDYFRPYDSLDLRPLLHWYTAKQSLFSSTNVNLLKPPTFLCRRVVLRMILANLYCDSEPWKLLVVRIKGQFHLALANQAIKRPEDFTLDDYSGYAFEALFKTDQPNTTRLKQQFPLEKPQEQFHTVQYWQFGRFNILYSNEIDGEIKENIPIPSTNNQMPKQEDQKSTKDTIENKDDEMEEEEDPSEDATKQEQINENLQLINNDETEVIPTKKQEENEIKAGYVEMKCTNKKIFYRDENKLKTLHWWAQMWLANTKTLMIGYKSSNKDGNIDQIDLFSIEQVVSKFLSKYNLHLKYSLSYLDSFLQLIEQTVTIDDPNTVHAFAYIPQPLEIDPTTGKPFQYDLPNSVPFRYTQFPRSNQRHDKFLPQWYLQTNAQETQPKTIDEEMKKRMGHRGRASCPLKHQKKDKHKRKH